MTNNNRKALSLRSVRFPLSASRFSLKPHHLLLTLLVLASLSVDAAAVAANRDGSTTSLVLALGLAQIGLLSAWLVWGRWNLVVRLSVWIGAVAFWSFPMSRANHHAATQWMAALTFYSLIVIAPLLLLRLKRFRFTSPSLASPPQSDGLRRWQFSLWNLFCFTTAVALMLGFGRLFRFPWALALEVTLFCAALGAVTVVALIGSLLSRNALTPIAASAFACLLVGQILDAQGSAVNFTCVAAIDSVFVALAALVVRIGEFRLEPPALTPAPILTRPFSTRG